MFLTRLVAVVVLAWASCGCQTLFKDDPIMGDHPWQPSGFKDVKTPTGS